MMSESYAEVPIHHGNFGRIITISVSIDPTCRSGGLGRVRLTDNITESEGRVEICTNGFRAGLCCDDLFDLQTANVLCRDIGLSSNNPGIYTWHG